MPPSAARSGRAIRTHSLWRGCLGKPMQAGAQPRVLMAWRSLAADMHAPKLPHGLLAPPCSSEAGAAPLQLRSLQLPSAPLRCRACRPRSARAPASLSTHAASQRAQRLLPCAAVRLASAHASLPHAAEKALGARTPRAAAPQRHASSKSSAWVFGSAARTSVCLACASPTRAVLRSPRGCPACRARSAHGRENVQPREPHAAPRTRTLAVGCRQSSSAAKPASAHRAGSASGPTCRGARRMSPSRVGGPSAHARGLVRKF